MLMWEKNPLVRCEQGVKDVVKYGVGDKKLLFAISEQVETGKTSFRHPAIGTFWGWTQSLPYGSRLFCPNLCMSHPRHGWVHQSRLILLGRAPTHFLIRVEQDFNTKASKKELREIGKIDSLLKHHFNSDFKHMILHVSAQKTRVVTLVKKSEVTESRESAERKSNRCSN